MSVGSRLTVKVSDAVSAAFEVAVTVYAPPGTFEATVKCAVSVPLEIEHVGELSRPDGEDERVHVVP